MTPEPLDLLGTPRPALGDALAERGLPPALASTLFRALHRDQPLATHPQIGPRHAARVEAVGWRPTLTPVARHPSPDGTLRLVLALHDGARVEAVLVPMPGGRTTLCLSSQVGCAMGCRFCATGTLGLTRHLRAGEIVGQLALARAEAAAHARTVDRIVFMGMGEPLHNLRATVDAVRVITDGAGPGMSGRRITVSTVGLPDAMVRFAEAVGPKVGLALSLHAGTDATRAALVPLGAKVPLARLRQTLRHPTLARRTWMAEYVVLPGVNDTEAEADGVAAFTAGLKVAVNLLPFNPFPGAPYASPSVAQVQAFADRLRARGVYVTRRTPKGRAVDGACGQLALRHGAASQGVRTDSPGSSTG